ncbi:DrmB family protein [Alkalimonas delamerensis]|uniref:DrmB family protein n=1 Tax=Alkalimonas delamerensis TaxID=265981 RepID=A0ABT9GKD8_9GAMM|nr:DrmB family protein [Alkalimonas delamerensis]MDP4527433.1 DrmB family protein [Alkalimonas delamerensis]
MNGEIRRAQLVQTFGVGAIVDASGETFIVKDTKLWKVDEKISCERLSRLIGNKRLRTFSSSAKSKDKGVPVDRFPRWYYCPSCNLMRFISKQEDYRNEKGACPRCENPVCKNKPEMIPMRFVAYCNNGHLAEINWHAWAHLNASKAEEGQCRDKDSLSFTSGGRAGGDFLEMRVTCKSCGCSENLSAIQRQFANPSVVDGYGNKCCGKQPWQSFDERDACNEEMKIEPRGSSSIHRALVLSALDIEQENVANVSLKLTAEEMQRIEKKCDKIIEKNEGLKQLLLERVVDFDEDLEEQFLEVADLLEIDDTDAVLTYAFDYLKGQLQQKNTSSILVDDPQLTLLDEEYQLLGRGVDVDQKHFKIFFNSLLDCKDLLLNKIFSRIGQVKRLREVRAFNGFVRGEGKTSISPDLSGSQNWVPALEAFGEGIYLELNQETISSWLSCHGSEIHSTLQSQLDAIKNLQQRVKVGIKEDPVFLLAHTMAHILIKDLTFRSGYSSSALRERIFCEPLQHRAGILIYTTDTDTEGTLGGLVDQARPDLQSLLVRNLVSLTRWCSADPVCRETLESGFQGVNQAACHCCSLVAETSCGHQNAGLNRLLLSGMGKDYDEPMGFLTYVEGLLA